MGCIIKAVNEAIRIAEDEAYGYSQSNRIGPDFDCSSFVSHCLNYAGYDISPTSWTGNMYAQLKKCGFTEVKAPWKAGDVHLTPGKHVVISISPERVATASINELGKTTGGKPGDQTGKEIYMRDYYGKWTYHLRPPYDSGATYSDVLDDIARQVIAGKYGNFPERKKLVEAFGVKYADVQARVNKLIHTIDSNGDARELGAVARDVIRGKYGNYPGRKLKIEAMGLDYNEVQKLVNSMTKKG